VSRWGNGTRLTVAELGATELERRLAVRGLRLRTGPAVTEVRSPLDTVAEVIALLYIEHEAVESFADFRAPRLAQALLGNGESVISNNGQQVFGAGSVGGVYTACAARAARATLVFHINSLDNWYGICSIGTKEGVIP
jgi:hypothetical protein